MDHQHQGFQDTYRGGRRDRYRRDDERFDEGQRRFEPHPAGDEERYAGRWSSDERMAEGGGDYGRWRSPRQVEDSRSGNYGGSAFGFARGRYAGDYGDEARFSEGARRADSFRGDRSDVEGYYGEPRAATGRPGGTAGSEPWRAHREGQAGDIRWPSPEQRWQDDARDWSGRAQDEYGRAAGDFRRGESHDPAFSSWRGHRGSGFAGRGPKNYQRSDDRILEQISDRMSDDDDLDPSDITIEVRQGVVTLSGNVASREQKRRAEDLAEQCRGVTEVVNNIRIARAGGQSLSTGHDQAQSVAPADKSAAPTSPGRSSK